MPLTRTSYVRPTSNHGNSVAIQSSTDWLASCLVPLSLLFFRPGSEVGVTLLNLFVLRTSRYYVLLILLRNHRHRHHRHQRTSCIVLRRGPIMALLGRATARCRNGAEYALKSQPTGQPHRSSGMRVRHPTTRSPSFASTSRSQAKVENTRVRILCTYMPTSLSSACPACP